MQSVSQEVVIDSIKETTLLDKKATIAQGNIIKQRDTLFEWYNGASILIDSLSSQIFTHKKETMSIREALNNTKQALNESEKQHVLEGEISELKDERYKAEIKHQKAKKWTWLGGGTLLGIILSLLFGG